MYNTKIKQEEISTAFPLRFLIIEDSDTDAAIIERTLRHYIKHFRVRRAATMAEGERELETHLADIDAVLLDLMLPDTKNAADTYHQIKKWADKVPIIIMTRLDDRELAKVMIEEGAADFICKDTIAKIPKRAVDAILFSISRHQQRRRLIAEKSEVMQESKDKDSLLNCFMGGYSILK